MDFHSYFSDNSDQNAATTFEHIKNLFIGCIRRTFSYRMVWCMILHMDVAKYIDVKTQYDYYLYIHLHTEW